MPTQITITTIIVAVALSKLYASGKNPDTLVEVISAFRECLRNDHKRIPACDLKLIELARAIRDDFGYLVGESPIA